LNNSKEAKVLYRRKTYGQEIEFPAQHTEVFTRINTTLITLWNLALIQCLAWLEMPKESPERKAITPISLNFWLTGVRASNADIAQVPIVLAREMLRRLAGSFGSYFALVKNGDKRARMPQQKDGEVFITLTWPEGSFIVNGDVLRVSIGNRQYAEFQLGTYLSKKLKDMPTDGKIAHVTIAKREGLYWVQMVFNSPKPENQPSQSVLAIDLGSGSVVCSSSDGTEFSIPTRRPDKYWRKNIASVEGRLEECTKNSRAWRRRMGARRNMHHSSNTQHTDHQRKLAHHLVKLAQQKYSAIVVGKMKTRLGLARSDGTPDQHWGVQNTGYAMRLLIFLKEKAQEYGVPLIELPDPKRHGEMSDPNSKFHASRKLLLSGCDSFKVTPPREFKRIKDLIIPQ
jgi:hypothetical protein